MYQIHLTGRKLNIASMTRLLKNRIRIIILRLQMIRILSLIGFSGYTGHNRILRIFFIWTPDIFGTPHSNTVVISCTAFRTHNIIILSALCQMRSFDAASVCTASPDSFWISYDFLIFRGIFHHTDCTWFFISFSCFPFQRNNILLSVGIMK